MDPRSLPTILIVDDVPDNLDVLRALLQDRYRVVVARSGDKALQIIGNRTPDLVLLDIMMPGLDGFETLARLREDPDRHELPVIFLSALGDLRAKTRGFALGAVDYITKPFEPEEVLARVRTHLAIRDAARLKEEVERIVRHDLKSPLNAIIATAQYELSNEDLQESTRETLELITDSGLDLLRMINLSLDLLKMERGLYVADPKPVALAALLHRVAREQRALVQAGRLTLELSGDEVLVRGEELLLYSLLGNVLRNALEAAPEGGVVTARLERTAAGARLVVRNPGEVPLAVRDRLFVKFATAGKAGGTGLGLYSARLIADTLGLGLEADLGEPGHTTFRLEFPTGEDA